VSYVLCISKMSRKFETVLFFLLLSATTRADTENEVAPSNEDTESFPSISSISRNDGSFSIPQPSLDLAPTDLAENSPMSFSIPSLELQLDETDFAKNAPMSFSITQPELDLKPSFAFEGLDQAPEQDDVAIKEKKLELEKEEVNYKNTTRRRRQVPDFPSIFSFRSSNNPFSIAFPSPDLSPGPSFFKFQDPISFNQKIKQTKFDVNDPLINEISDTTHDKRQVSFFNFRPSKLLSQSGLRPSQPILPVKKKQVHPFKHKPRPSPGSKFATLDPVLLGPISGEVARPVRQNRPPPQYPPFDPFNTTYIPLPGPSSPRFALPLSGGNPHMNKGAENAIFRRPIRQSFHSPVLPATQDLRGKYSGPDPELDVFKYESSKQFRSSKLGRLLRSRPRSVPK